MEVHDYQDTDTSCGPSALGMVLMDVIGPDAPTEAQLIKELHTDGNGTHVDELVAAVARRGLEHKVLHGAVGLDELRRLLEDHAVMVCYQSSKLHVGHFAVVDSIKASHLVLSDPWFGPKTCLDLDTFLDCWRSEPDGSPPLPRWTLAVKRD